MTVYVTTRDVEFSGGTRIMIPKGTVVVPVQGGMGINYAVRDAKLVAQLSGDPHGAKHYYAWVPTDAVSEREGN